MTPYAKAHSATMALSNHAMLHFGCGPNCPTARQLTADMKEAMAQASNTMATDREAQDMQQATQERIREEVDGWRVLCHLDGCRASVGWTTDPKEADRMEYEHTMAHARQGQQATTSIVPERGVAP